MEEKKIDIPEIEIPRLIQKGNITKIIKERVEINKINKLFKV
jgi:hypothetical protein